jgi:molybdate transport system regulatory protein
MKISARNKLMGQVQEITPGSVNSVVKIRLTGEPVITAVVTNESVSELGLQQGSSACAVVKASTVMLGVCNEGAGCSTGCQGHTEKA